jgi:preprotein translocase subunit SecA
LGLSPAELQSLDCREAGPLIEERLRHALAEKKEQLLGADGQIRRDAQALLERMRGEDDQTRLRLLMVMAQGTRTAFDARTHRQVRQVYFRLPYGFYAGEILKRRADSSLAEEILDHLHQASAALQSAFQEAEAVRLGTPPDSPQALESGRRIRNQIHRQVLLGGISELWVDYLTRVEALRISVSLEAYAQRDPLVQYKTRASEMFQTLLTDIRAAVVSRMFLYRPRTASQIAESGQATRQEAEGTPAGESPAQVTRADRKRKRHRH